MKYKFTQLKDLPGSDAGTVYKCNGVGKLFRKLAGCSETCYEMVIDGYIQYAPVNKTVLDDPKWFKREIDYDGLRSFCCPKCGNSNLRAYKNCWHCSDMDSDDYGDHCTVKFECPCGYKWEW